MTPINNQWTALSERKPTAEDADECGCVITVHHDRRVASITWDRLHKHAVTHWMRSNLPPKPDPIPDLIAEILQMEGMHPDTRRLIELAIEAQRTGALPAFIPAKARQLGMCPFPPTPNA